MDEIWAISVFAEKLTLTGHRVVHAPLTRKAVSAAEAKGLGFEWLEKNYPSAEGWTGYHANVIPVFKEYEAKLIAEGRATQ